MGDIALKINGKSVSTALQAPHRNQFSQTAGYRDLSDILDVEIPKDKIMSEISDDQPAPSPGKVAGDPDVPSGCVVGFQPGAPRFDGIRRIIDACSGSAQR